jgi:hypothetical protein
MEKIFFSYPIRDPNGIFIGAIPRENRVLHII